MSSKFWNEKQSPKWFRGISVMIALFIWTLLFLALLAPFFY